MADPAGPPFSTFAPEDSVDQPSAPCGPAVFAAPSFYITGREPLSPSAYLLAVVLAVGVLCLAVYVQGRAAAAQAARQSDADDPDQVDVIVIGAPGHSRPPARAGTGVTTVHPTILVHLPRSGGQVGFIPNTLAGHALYDWLAAFNRASYPALANTFPSAAPASVIEAQLELRRLTGGFGLLSAKEVEPGTLIFRLQDQTPAATEFLGSLQARLNGPAPIASFGLNAVSSPGKEAGPQNGQRKVYKAHAGH